MKIELYFGIILIILSLLTVTDITKYFHPMTANNSKWGNIGVANSFEGKNEILKYKICGIALPNDKILKEICLKKYGIDIEFGGCIMMPNDGVVFEKFRNDVINKFGVDVVVIEEKKLNNK